ncbi:class F sortase [Pseudonocardia humida]|uniref:Class F sortase n=1 Tax=Pseudonocardia humida TaxID=2800819 RepID=A0ABT0ZXX5_9PSEU|nr:class F sortase [Pseudonocardia humida]MCO1655599.1 class F sortase [Pseudonocardia humida]
MRVRIPAIGVDSAVTPIGLDAGGALQPPEDTESTGWFAGGPVPGAVGPAVLACHVDSRSGPAVFYRLRELPEGARIEVDRSDGTTAAFVVRSTVQTAEAAFPTAAVYAPTPAPELRLVTCGGTFDRSIGHYRDDVVVAAVLEPRGWTIPG